MDCLARSIDIHPRYVHTWKLRYSILINSMVEKCVCNELEASLIMTCEPFPAMIRKDLFDFLFVCFTQRLWISFSFFQLDGVHSERFLAHFATIKENPYNVCPRIFCAIFFCSFMSSTDQQGDLRHGFEFVRDFLYEKIVLLMIFHARLFEHIADSTNVSRLFSPVGYLLSTGYDEMLEGRLLERRPIGKAIQCTNL